jgi:type IV pilus assembly protein PilV
MKQSMKNIASRTVTRRQSGFTMIELLVSFLIFAFGMLGLAGLQVATIQYGQSSMLRTQATALTDDVLDRMRVDSASAKAGDWNTALEDTVESLSEGTTIHEVDLKDWKTAVEELLPSGRASITVNNGLVTVIIEWDDHRGDETRRVSGNTLQQIKTMSRL